MPDRYGNAVPSNYVKLPTVKQRDAPPEHERDHFRCRPGLITGVLELRFETLDPLRVGQGSHLPARYPTEGARLVADLAMGGGKPYVPGSSIKGATRSVAEALLGGCDEPGSCRPCCVACGLFGYVAGNETFMGRVGFEDAVAESASYRVLNVATPFPPRKPIGRRVYGARPAEAGAKDPVLAVPPGSTFRSRLVVRNLAPSELGGVLVALGLDGSFAPRLGGAKHFGFGRVRFDVTSARVRTQGYAKRARSLGPEEARLAVAEWIQAADLPPGADRVLAVLRAQMPSPNGTA